jgi:hypothetical protein
MEERIVGRETTVAILDGQALPVVEVRRGACITPTNTRLERRNIFVPRPSIRR